MTPTHTDSPLRRSEVGTPRTPVHPPVINDDEEERRQARRRTVFEESSSSTIEENETLKNCLKIYSENKLSKENAWSVSLIDTLSTLLDKHHKSLNNFKVAGSSLEASSKVYGLRVDSIHTDVLRMSSGLNKQRFIEQDEEVEDNAADQSQLPQEQANVEKQVEQEKRPKKRVKKAVHTVTKNKETINARLDTNPFTDPIFAKLNSIAGSINSSSRLLQNILHSSESELGLRMDKPFWDSEPREPILYPEQHNYSELLNVDATELDEIELEDHVLRPNHTGYIISDTPAEQDDDNKENVEDFEDDRNNSQMAVAFDINAEVEPVSVDAHTFVDVDMGELEELTVEEQVAIQNCKGLRRTGVMLVDLRPVDSTSSTLEYSYRPLDKISQFWAGPSHWKFKSRGKSSVIALRQSSLPQMNEKSKTVNQRGRRRATKFRSMHILFEEKHEELFQKLDENSNKTRKANIQKKWDAKKLKLPTDLQIDRNVFDVFNSAPGIAVQEEIEETITPDIPIQSEYDYDNPADQEYCSNISDHNDYEGIENPLPMGPEEDVHHSQTIMEIASDFIGAPDKVTKIVVPFAKRAKVIDMKQLKKCCTRLLTSQFAETEKENIPQLPEYSGDKYKKGVASFNNIYKSLPEQLSQNMAEALSPSVAFYSILHLANEANFRLIPQDDLNDFQILQLDL